MSLVFSKAGTTVYPGLILYRCFLWLALPFVMLRLWWRGRRDPTYRPRWRERFGFYRQSITPNALWFHTVSAGESISAAPIIRELAEGGVSTHPLLVTSMTPTGIEQVTRLLGNSVEHCYAPYDFTFAVRRFLAHVQPHALILMETEIWPNLILEAKAQGIPVLLMNARLSDKSARGYHRFGWLGQPVLQAVDLIACQTEAHARHFQALGVLRERLQIVGNVKYDLDVTNDVAQGAAQLRSLLGAKKRSSWIAASTHPGEEELILQAHQQVLSVHPDALLWLAPRHTNRATQLIPLLDVLTQPMPGGWCRYSDLVNQSTADAGDLSVVLVDQMGVLMPLYELADVAFMGGSLVVHGGHNPIEPASLGTPVITGPHHVNFSQVFTDLMQAGACIISEQSCLANEVGQLMSNPKQRQIMGAGGVQVVAINRGAKQRCLRLLEQHLKAR